MSSHPTPAPASPAADLVAANRNPFAIALVVLGLLLLGAGIYYLSKGIRSQSAVASKSEGEDKDKDKPAEAPLALDNPNRAEHLSGGVFGVLAGLAAAGLGAWLLARPAPPTEAARQTEARTALLAAGGLVGLILMLGGLWFLYLWFGHLTNWLENRKAENVRWVYALVVFLVGAALAFVAALPARAEERNNAALRRLVYGINFALTALLLFTLLLVGNVFAALRVPNKLDTTESGFYTLSDPTKELIARLDQPVTAYSTLFDVRDDQFRRLIQDARSLLTSCQEVNPARFRPRFLSPTLDQKEINRLAAKFPQFDKNDIGILLVVGDDESKAGFIKFDDLFTREVEGRTGTLVFQGEARLVRELMFLTADAGPKAVYFTQGSGELEVAPAADPEALRTAGRRTANQLKAAVEANRIDVRPLRAEVGRAAVPDDAVAVVVADPQSRLSAPMAEALRAYMTAPRPGGRKGKLVVMSGPFPRPGGGGVGETGLEDLLREFGVELGQHYLYTEEFPQLTHTEVIAVTNPGLADAGNAVATAFQRRRLIFPNCRTVSPSRGGGPFQAEWLFASFPEERATWLETDPPADPERTWNEILKSPDLARAKRATNQSGRPVAALVSESDAAAKPGDPAVGRVAVFGSGQFFADATGRRGQQSGQAAAELFATTLDWLRDRPAAAAVANKKYGVYTPNPEPSEVRLLALPLGATMLAVIALGVGVWVSRQR